MTTEELEPYISHDVESGMNELSLLEKHKRFPKYNEYLMELKQELIQEKFYDKLDEETKQVFENLDNE